MYLVFDIGGTHTRLAVSEEGKTLRNTTIFETPQSFLAGIGAIVQKGREIGKGKKFKAIAGGVAGPLNQDKSSLVNAPNLKDWVQRPLKKELEKRLGTPVYLENDSALVGLGEAAYGAGKHFSIVAYFTVSTGLGGARIVDKKIDRNAMGFEPGHQIIAVNGPVCPSCGIPGDLESYVSGVALRKKYGKPPEEITDNRIWDEVSYHLALGIHNTLLHWSPDVFVLGGPLMKSISLEKVKTNLEKILAIFPKAPPVKRAELGDIGGLYGALSLIQIMI